MFIKRFILIVLLLAVCTACSVKSKPYASNDSSQTESMMYEWPLERHIDESPLIFYGKCTEKVIDKNYNTAVMSFDIQEAVRGNHDVNVKEFRSIYPNHFSVGGYYLLFCEKLSSVYEDTTFYSVGTVIYQDKEKLVGDGVELKDLYNIEDVLRSVRSYVSAHPFSGDTSEVGAYCHSDDLNEIYEFSNYVFKAEITEVVENDFPNRTSYKFDLIESLKGDIDPEQVYVTALKDSMRVGEKYLIMANLPSEGSLFFGISSRYSVLPADTEFELMK